MEVVILEDFKIVGLKITCIEERLGIEMPKLWKNFNGRINEINGRKDNCVMDISLSVIDKNYTQCICVRVDDFHSVPEGMDAVTIPSQKYVYFKHEGPVEEIWMSFWSMQKWARENGYILDPLDFKMDINKEEDNSIHDLYIKIL